MKTVPSTNRVIPLHPEGARRFPKGDRKALWSPMRAKPSPWIKDYPFLIRYLLHVFPTATRGLSDRPLDPFGVPSVVACPSNKQEKIPLTKNSPSPSGLGVMGQGAMPLAGCRGGAPAGSPEGKALWWGCRGQSPRLGCGAKPRKRAKPRKGQRPLVKCATTASCHCPAVCRACRHRGSSGQ